MADAEAQELEEELQEEVGQEEGGQEEGGLEEGGQEEADDTTAPVDDEDKKLAEVTGQASSGDSREAIDSRSVYIGNVDYSATDDELKAHFQGCGTINRATIRKDKVTSKPLGYAYIEFAQPYSVELAVTLNGTTFKGRELKVVAKRTNLPHMGRASVPRGRGRGGFRARGRGYYPRRGRGRGYMPY
eukprot:m.70464 g.70464  ORF g.70464 m.70464 type:complete len:187 (+) comp50139_c0_seq1:237-797(+)